MKRKEIRERLDVLSIEMDNITREWRRKSADKEALAERKEKIRAERRMLNKKLRRRELIRDGWPMAIALTGYGVSITGLVLIPITGNIVLGFTVLLVGVWTSITGMIIESARPF